jgi:hypothetical protein
MLKFKMLLWQCAVIQAYENTALFSSMVRTAGWYWARETVFEEVPGSWDN